jgi:cytoskeletal protein CcmA (bactofilin family)
MFFRKHRTTGGTSPLVVSGGTSITPTKVQPPTIKKSPLEGFAGDGVVLIGKGTKMTGQIKDSTMIEIQGHLDGDIVASAVIVREGATFTGNMITAYAEIHGTVDGTITAEELLDIRSTGRVTAEVKYGNLSVATGGRLSGELQAREMIELDAEKNPAATQVIAMNGTDRHQKLN